VRGDVLQTQRENEVKVMQQLLAFDARLPRGVRTALAFAMMAVIVACGSGSGSSAGSGDPPAVPPTQTEAARFLT
jgi:hypothetical protein